MLTNRSSAALWMWKTSSLKRQRQVELCSASFHSDKAVASLFSTEWHKMKPTAKTRSGKKWVNKQDPDVEAGGFVCFQRNYRGKTTTKRKKLTDDPLLHGIKRKVFTGHLQTEGENCCQNLPEPGFIIPTGVCVCTNGVRLCRVEHGGGSRDERQQLGVPPLVSRQIPPGVNHLEADQGIGQRLDGQEEERVWKNRGVISLLCSPLQNRLLVLLLKADIFLATSCRAGSLTQSFKMCLLLARKCT